MKRILILAALIFFVYNAHSVIADNVLIISAHPDDETIGAGGKIIQSVKNGDVLRLIMMTDGAPDERFDEDPCYDEEEYRLTRANETIAAMALAGVPEENITFLGYDDWGFVFDVQGESMVDTINNMSELMMEFEPDEIYIHAYEHGNIDHDTAHYITVRAMEKNGLMKSVPVFEYVEYNPFFWGEPIPEEVCSIDSDYYPITYLEMSNEEVLLKKQMLTQYKSQDISGFCQNETPAIPGPEITGDIISINMGWTPLTEAGKYLSQYGRRPAAGSGGQLSLSGPGSWTDCEQALIDTYYFGPDMIRPLPSYDYTKSPCKGNSCTWLGTGSWKNNDFYRIISETDILLGIKQPAYSVDEGQGEDDRTGLGSITRIFLLSLFAPFYNTLFWVLA